MERAAARPVALAQEHRSAHFCLRFEPVSVSPAEVAVLAVRLEEQWHVLEPLLGAQHMPSEPILLRLNGVHGAAGRTPPVHDSAATMAAGWTLDVSYRARSGRRALQAVRRSLLELLLTLALGARATQSPLLVEGLLGYLALPSDARALARLRASVDKRGRRKRPFALSELDASAPTWEQRQFAAAAALFTAFLVTAYGPERYRQFAQHLTAGGLVPALEAAYGRSLAAVERKWRATLPAPLAPKRSLGWILRRAFAYWRPYGVSALLIAFTICLQDKFKSDFANALGAITDRATSSASGSLGGLVRALAVSLTVMFVIAAGANVAQDYLTSRASAKILNDIRLKLFTHLQRLSTRYYSHAQTGDIVAHFTSDLGDIDKGLTSRISDGYFSIIGILWWGTQLFLVQWRLAVAMLLGLPLLMTTTRLFAPRASSATYLLKRQQAELASAVQENVKAQPVIKVFGLQGFTLAAFRARLATLYDTALRSNFLSQSMGTASSLAVTLLTVAFPLVGAVLVARHAMSIGSLIVANVLFGLIAGEAYNLTKKVAPSLLSAAGALRRLDELLDEQPEIADVPDATTTPRLANEIRFESVTFRYEEEQPTLDHVSFTIPAGRYVAFVGPSGSGKTTILNLLMRFYDPSTGAVRLDGVDLRMVTQDSLRAQIAAVFQDTFLFNATIRENIRLGKLDASDAEIEAAAKAAEIHELIASLPQGYETPTGEMGSLLSGGQRQRLAIARALLRDPAILILDEPTSALDPSTENAITATIERLAKQRTVIAVTHRLASVEHAHCIFVLQAGRLVEQGAHEELLARHNLYYELWQKQHGFAISSDGRQATLEMSWLQATPLFSVPLFAELDPAVLAMVARHFDSTHYDAGETLAHEGQPCDTFFVIVRGKVEVVLAGTAGKERRIAVLEDGDYFGEMALFEDTLSAATVRTLHPCLIVSLRRDRFLDLLATQPKLRDAFAHAAESRSLQVLVGTEDGIKADAVDNGHLFLRP